MKIIKSHQMVNINGGFLLLIRYEKIVLSILLKKPFRKAMCIWQHISDIQCTYYLVIPLLGIYTKTNVQDVQGWAKTDENSVTKDG